MDASGASGVPGGAPGGRPAVAWAGAGDHDHLRFAFTGHLTVEGALAGIADWRSRLAERPAGRVVHVWDCRSMTGYDTAARVAWQGALGELRPRIEEIWLVSGSPIVRIGATVMNLVTSLRLHAVAEASEVVLGGRPGR